MGKKHIKRIHELDKKLDKIIKSNNIHLWLKIAIILYLIALSGEVDPVHLLEILLSG